jgi:hypothetical protein
MVSKVGSPAWATGAAGAGAVNWLQTNRPEQSRIYGVKRQHGGALIEAAADDSPRARIEAIAVYGTFDDLNLLPRDIAKDRFSSLRSAAGDRRHSSGQAQVGPIYRASARPETSSNLARLILVAQVGYIIPLIADAAVSTAMQPKKRLGIERGTTTDHQRRGRRPGGARFSTLPGRCRCCDCTPLHTHRRVADGFVSFCIAKKLHSHSRRGLHPNRNGLIRPCSCPFFER